MKITVLGWYGHGNVGDESYKASFPLLFPNDQLLFTNLIKPEHHDSDLFILGGGAVLEEPFIQQLRPFKNKIALSVTANKNNLQDFKQVFVRDVKSYQAIPSVLMPDAAFLLNPTQNDAIKPYFQNRDLYQKKVVCVYNAHLSVVQGQLARDQLNFLKVTNDLADIIDRTAASFVFIPFGNDDPWNDRITNSWLASKCKFWKKNFVIYDKISFQQALDIIASADAVISTRLHASIFSCVAKVPFIDITHHDKNLGFLQTVGLEDWSIPYWRFNYEKCLTLLNEFLTKPTTKLQTIVEAQRHQIAKVMNHVRLLSH
jgi:polysaccharide pyruvyl transferase WcaK-like protein